MRTPQNNEIILRDADGGWLHFSRPHRILCAHTLDEVLPVLEGAAASGGWAAGYLCYEAAPAFDSALSAFESKGPLAWFGVYDQPQRVVLPDAEPQETEWLSDTAEDEYCNLIAKIKEHIQEGDSYQVNYTIRMHADIVDPWQLFLGHMTNAGFSAYIQSPDRSICSASPELFFELDGTSITCRPMKGTGRDPDELKGSVKDRAENIMIVDMIRNDLGRICRPGTIVAAPLYETEPFGNIWQMTSTVRGETSASFSDIFKALFPCASITGAPKRRTMQIIKELESTPRSVYCGAIGYIAPGRKARFSVSIRTAEVDRKTGDAVYGVGGGIVWDSQPQAEWQECALKAEVLSSERGCLNTISGGSCGDCHSLRSLPAYADPTVLRFVSPSRVSSFRDSKGDGEFPHEPHLTGNFQLLETMLYDNKIAYEEEHVERLTRSAAKLGFKLDVVVLRDELNRVTGGRQRLRLLLGRDGTITLKSYPFPAQEEPLRKVVFTKDPVDSRIPLLYHKTTQRDLYNKAKAEFSEADDVILCNTRGEVTESTIANVVVRIDGELLTPPLSCGLLPGTMRAALLREGVIKERVINLEEFRQADEQWLINSLRGWMPVEIAISLSQPKCFG